MLNSYQGGAATFGQCIILLFSFDRNFKTYFLVED